MNLYTVVASTLKIDPSTLSKESNANNTPNWDSLRHIELMMSVESFFGVRFTLAEIAGMQNLGDMQTLLKEKGVNLGNEEHEKQTVSGSA